MDQTAPPVSPESRFAAYARSGDPSLLEGLMREHADQAYTQARRLLGRSDLAEDAVQDACVRLIDSAARYQPGIPFAAWFGRLVSLASIDQRRRRARHHRVITKAASLAPKAIDEPQRDRERDANEAQLEPLRAALAALPENYRTPLSLYYLAGLDRESIAQALGLRPGTVAVRLTRGIDRLRTSMARFGSACSAVALVDILGGMPSYAAEPSLHVALAGIATTPAAAGSVGGWSAAAKAVWMKLAAALAGTTVAVVGVVTGVAALHTAPAPAASSTNRATAALVRAMPADSWLAIPDTHLHDVAPPREQYPHIQGGGDVRGVIGSWSGGALDTKRDRLLVWGGGYSGYWGNEIYAFDIAAMRWERLTEPFPEPVLDAREANADGTPKSRGTYGGLAYLAHSDRFFAAGGCTGPATDVHAKGTWLFDLTAKQWIDRGVLAGGKGYGCCCAYDPSTRLVWFACDSTWGPGGLWTYDDQSDAWTKRHPDDNYEVSCALDSKRGVLMVVGRGHVFAYDLRASPVTKSEWTTSGGDAFVAKEKPGLDYDPVIDRIVGWHGGAVYALDPQTRIWTASAASGALDTTVNGIYGRWRYVPSLDVFIVATDTDANVHFYKPPK
ncbi:MAG: sigma-70 family RNA polymerase sigma factor [Planctomycetes bacterium]|nr:sigma-70 family RNA polymerase sigma factor [Planctomycetota bacterium]